MNNYNKFDIKDELVNWFVTEYNNNSDNNNNNNNNNVTNESGTPLVSCTQVNKMNKLNNDQIDNNEITDNLVNWFQMNNRENIKKKTFYLDSDMDKKISEYSKRFYFRYNKNLIKEYIENGELDKLKDFTGYDILAMCETQLQRGGMKPSTNKIVIRRHQGDMYTVYLAMRGCLSKKTHPAASRETARRRII